MAFSTNAALSPALVATLLTATATGRGALPVIAGDVSMIDGLLYEERGRDRTSEGRTIRFVYIGSHSSRGDEQDFERDY
jgi:hypothetical protein